MTLAMSDQKSPRSHHLGGNGGNIFRDNSFVSTGSSFISIDVESLPDSEDNNCSKKDSGSTKDNLFTVELRKIIELRELQKQAEFRLQKAKSATAGKLRKEEGKIASVLHSNNDEDKEHGEGEINEEHSIKSFLSSINNGKRKEKELPEFRQAQASASDSKNVMDDESNDNKNRKGVEKRAFLRKRSGLLRFYKDPNSVPATTSPPQTKRNTEETCDPVKPTINKSRVKGKNIKTIPLSTDPKSQEKSMKKFQSVSYNGKANEKRKTNKSPEEEPIWPEVMVVENGKNPLVTKNENKLLSFKSVSEEDDDEKVAKSDTDIEKQELKIFEKMERATKRPGFQESSKVAQKFITNEINLDETMETQSEAVAESDNDSDSSYEDISDQNSVASVNIEVPESSKSKTLTQKSEIDHKQNTKCSTNSSDTDSETSSEESDKSDSTLSSSDSEDESSSCSDVVVNESYKPPKNTSVSQSSNPMPYNNSFTKTYEKQLSPRFQVESSLTNNNSKVVETNVSNGSSPQAIQVRPKSPDASDDVRIALKLKQLEGEMAKFNNQNQLVVQLRQKIEREKYEFEIEKRRFYRYKEKELVKLQATKAALDKQQAHFDVVAEESRKVKETNAKHLAEIANLKRKIDSLEKEMKQKSSSWESSRIKLQDWINELENERERLESEVGVGNKSSLSNSSSTSSLRGSKMKKRIHFADEQPNQKEVKTGVVKNPKHAFGSSLKNCAEKTNTTRSCGDLVRTTAKRNGRIDHSRMKRPVLKSSTDCENLNNEEEDQLFMEKSENVRNGAGDMVNNGNGGFLFGNTESNDSENENNDPLQSTLPNGDTQLLYPNGTKKVISKSGHHMRISYWNGDIKEVSEDGTISYYFVESGLKQTTFPSGLDILEYSSGVVERSYSDGKKEITYPNGCAKYVYVDGSEEYIYTDQTVVRTDVKGEKTIILPNGEKEYHRNGYKKRVYPDGTEKIVYADGSQETRYKNGRIRVKDKQGNLIHDTVDNNGVRVPFNTCNNAKSNEKVKENEKNKAREVT